MAFCFVFQACNQPVGITRECPGISQSEGALQCISATNTSNIHVIIMSNAKESKTEILPGLQFGFLIFFKARLMLFTLGMILEMVSDLFKVLL